MAARESASQACLAASVGGLVVVTPWASHSLPILAFWAALFLVMMGILLRVLYTHI